MSQREIRRRLVSSHSMKKAWKLFKSCNHNCSFSCCLKLAWRIIKGLLYPAYSKVRGVTFENRQALIKRLTHYPKSMIGLTLEPEHDNPFDKNAVKIIAAVIGKGAAIIGYVSKDLAPYFTAELKLGKNIILILEDITGAAHNTLGVNYSYFII